MSESMSEKNEKAPDSTLSGPENSSDFENPDLPSEVKNIFEREDLQPWFKKLVKVGVSEALEEHDVRVKVIERQIGDKNLKIMELEEQKSILKGQLRHLTGTIEENKHKIQKEIDELNKEIDKKKTEVTVLKKELKREKKLSEERDTKLAQLEKDKGQLKAEKDQLKAEKQQALSQRNNAIRKLNDLKQK